MTPDSPLPLFSTAYFPSILYMAHLCHYAKVGIEVMETFPKQTFRNRTVIATGNGLQTLTVPVVRTQGNHTRTEEIGISYNEPWNVRHWRAIVSAYNAAPYFLYYRDEIEHVLMQQYNRLIDLNDDLLGLLLKNMKIACTSVHTQDFTPPLSQDNDHRHTLTAKHIVTNCQFPPYYQTFDTRYGFQPNLSVLDLLFNLGPDAKGYLLQLNIT